MDQYIIFSKEMNDARGGHETGASAIHDDKLFMQIFDRVNQLVQPDTPVENVTVDFLPKIRGEAKKTNWQYSFQIPDDDGQTDLIIIQFEFNDRDELVIASAISSSLHPDFLNEKLPEIDFTDPDALIKERLQIIKFQSSDAGATFKFITCGIDGYTIKKN